MRHIFHQLLCFFQGFPVAAGTDQLVHPEQAFLCLEVGVQRGVRWPAVGRGGRCRRGMQLANEDHSPQKGSRRQPRCAAVQRWQIRSRQFHG